jgi:hypothetical protein
MKSLNLADNNGAEYAQKPRTNSQQLFFNVPSGKLPIILKKKGDPGCKKINTRARLPTQKEKNESKPQNALLLKKTKQLY